MAGKRRSEPTRLALIRKRRGLTQEELAQATGVPLTTIYRLEARQIDNPRIRHLRNLAIALDVDFEHLLEDEWKGWTSFSAEAAAPPDLERLLGPWYRGQNIGSES